MRLNRLATIAKCCLRPETRGREGASFDISASDFSKRVPHLGPLRLEIARVVRVRFAPDRHLLDHLNSVAFEADDLLGIVREKTKLAPPEIEKNLRAEPVIAQIAGKPEPRVCLKRVEPFLL